MAKRQPPKGQSVKIVLVSLYYEPDVASTGVYLARVMEGLRRLGHDVTVVTSFPHYDGQRIAEPWRGRLAERTTVDGVDVIRTWVHAAGEKASLPHRALNYVTFNAASTVAGLVAGRPDVVVTASPPLTAGLTAWTLSRLWRVPFVYCLQDIYPDVAVRLGALKDPRVIRFFQAMERFIYARAAGIAVLSEGFRQNLLAKGVPDAKIGVVPYFLDTGFIHPLPRDNAFARAHGLAERFVVMHAGNVGFSQDLESLLAVAERLRDDDGVRFVIVGDGAAKPALRQRAAERGLDNVLFLPYQPAAVLPELRASADVHVALLKERLASYSVPCKVYEVMASGRPVVSSIEEGSDTWRLLRAGGCGIAVPPEDVDALAAAIAALRSDPARRERLGASGREHVVATYSTEVVVPQFAELVERVIGAAAR